MAFHKCTCFLRISITLIASVRRRGPLWGHWMGKLGLIISVEDGEAFICSASVADGVTETRATFRCSGSASNMYTHFKTKHHDIYSIVRSVIQGRTNNKRARTYYTTISDVVARSRQKSVESAFLYFFASSDIPKSMIEQPRFKHLLNTVNDKFTVSSSLLLTKVLRKVLSCSQNK